MRIPEKISAVLIALDEASRIGDAIDSVQWADEILVVDGGSRDGTREISRSRGARVVARRFTSYVDQKNFALDRASHEWVLSLDADERVTEALADEIHSLSQSGFHAAGYRIPRVSHYLGRVVRSTAWYPDHQLRLFDRRHGRWQGMYVHESVRVDGSVEKLRGEILHYSYDSISDHVDRMNRYAELSARQMWESGRRSGIVPAVAYPPLVFLKNYIIKRGFRDAAVGFTISVMNAFYVYLKYIKLWELRRKHRLDGS